MNQSRARPTRMEFNYKKVLWPGLIAVGLFGLVALNQMQALPSARAQTNGSRDELERQLQQLEREARELDAKFQQIQGERRTLDNEIAGVDTEIKRRQLEINRLALVLRKTQSSIQQAQAGISVLSQKIDKQSKALGASLFLLYVYDQDNTLSALLKYNRLSDFFTSLDNLKEVQSDIQGTLDEFKEGKTQLEEEKAELEDFQQEQEQLKALQEVERRFLAQKRKEKEELLRLTKGKEAIFQQLLQTKQRDIATLKTQLYYLEQTGITAEDAVRIADQAAKRAGIRTAFLLALLEVETGKQFEDGVISVGTNLGTGNWKRDLYDCYVNLKRPGTAEAEKRAFMGITSKLGLDPDRMPVSRKPNYGCGGAMGSAQFLPTTWLRFESKVARLTGHNPPSPWNVEDAFTAAAIFLSESGAASKTADGEIRAAKTYLSGRPSCSSYICRSYSNRIISLSRDIDRIL